MTVGGDPIRNLRHGPAQLASRAIIDPPAMDDAQVDASVDESIGSTFQQLRYKWPGRPGEAISVDMTVGGDLIRRFLRPQASFPLAENNGTAEDSQQNSSPASSAVPIPLPRPVKCPMCINSEEFIDLRELKLHIACHYGSMDPKVEQ